MPQKNATDTKKIIKEHIEELDKEFKIHKSSLKELVQYREHLMHALKIACIRRITPTEIKNMEQELRGAHLLILDIEQKLKKEFGESHRFLE